MPELLLNVKEKINKKITALNSIFIEKIFLTIAFIHIMRSRKINVAAEGC